MPRLSRAESMALTREKLLKSALALYSSHGYDAVTIEQISEACGFSRGAFYAHFVSKEAIFLELIGDRASKVFAEFVRELGAAVSAAEAIDIVCRWADRRAKEPKFSYLFVEVLQAAKRGNSLTFEQMAPIREGWRKVGEALARFFPDGIAPASAEEIGAIVLLQVADGPFIKEAGGPKPSRLVRIMLNALLRP